VLSTLAATAAMPQERAEKDGARLGKRFKVNIAGPKGSRLLSSFRGRMEQE
jgi:hypothetical protein